MKLLITGATGLVGKELVKKAQASGLEIHFLTTQQSKINSIDDAKGFYWNPERQEIDTSCFEGVSTIVHLAGATISKRWTTAL
jgi:NAD dependent epimerase/dehydratase family enzyme